MHKAIYMSGITMTAAASSIVALLLMVATSPTAIGPFGVTGWFLLAFVALSGWITLGLYWLSGRLQHAVVSSKRLKTAGRRGTLIAAVLTVWLGLSSLAQLTPRDIILTLILAILVEFYFRGRV